MIKIQLASFFVFGMTFLSLGQSVTFNQFKKEANLRFKCEMAFLLSDYYVDHNHDSIEVVINILIPFSNDKIYSNVVRSTILYIDGRRAVLNQGDILLARRKMYKAINYFYSQQDFEKVVLCYMVIANSYYFQGSFEKAISYYQRATKLAIELDNSVEYLESLFGISRSYVEVGDTIKGLNFLKEYAKLTFENDFPRSFAKAIAYEAMIRFDSGDEKSARILYKKSAGVALSSDLGEEYADGLTNQAIYFYLIEQFDSSEVYFKKALEKRIEVGDIKPIIESNFNLGSLYFGQEDYQNSLPYFRASKYLAKQNGFWLDEKDVNEELLSFHKKSPLNSKLIKQILEDQKRLEKKVEHETKIHSDLDGQLMLWLEDGRLNLKQDTNIVSNSFDWLSIPMLFGLILTSSWFLKRNWN